MLLFIEMLRVSELFAGGTDGYSDFCPAVCVQPWLFVLSQ